MNNSILKKTGDKTIGDFIFLNGGASLVRLGLVVGSVVGDLANYVNLQKAMTEGDGVLLNHLHL